MFTYRWFLHSVKPFSVRVSNDFGDTNFTFNAEKVFFRSWTYVVNGLLINFFCKPSFASLLVKPLLPLRISLIFSSVFWIKLRSLQNSLCSIYLVATPTNEWPPRLTCFEGTTFALEFQLLITTTFWATPCSSSTARIFRLLPKRLLLWQL